MPGTGPSRGWERPALFQWERFSICHKMKKCHHRVTSCSLVKSQDKHLWVSPVCLWLRILIERQRPKSVLKGVGEGKR